MGARADRDRDEKRQRQSKNARRATQERRIEATALEKTRWEGVDEGFAEGEALRERD